MILVFGSHGQLGQELVAMATARGLPVAGLSHRDADIADAGAVAAAVARVKPTFIVNCAAYNQVDRAESDVAAATRTNATGPAVIATAAEAAGVPVVHISTDYVFDGDKAGAWTEDDPVRPLSVYGRTKAEGEAGVRTATDRHLILRTAWVFGAYGANFVKTVMKMAGERDRLDMVADATSSPTSTADLAHAILLAEAAVRGGSAPWGTYHVAGEGAASRYEQAVAVVEAQAPFTGRRPTVNPVPSSFFAPAARRPVNSALDSSRFAAAFGFRPGPWREAVVRAVNEIMASRNEVA